MLSANSLPNVVDVLIVGGGPSGLVTAHILVRAGLKVLSIEQHDKVNQALLGRASMLYAGSLELLDTIGIYDRIADIGHIVRDSSTFKDGREIEGRGWRTVVQAAQGKTFFDYCFSVRQMHLEDALRTAISEVDSDVLHAPAKLVDFVVDSDGTVIATVEQGGNCTKVRSKFLIGADGGRSTVRTLSQIPFPGTPAQFKWVRMDAVVRSNLPRHAVAVESASHGNVLWMPIDNGRTRIGFVCPDALYGKCGENLSAALVMEEAKKAVQPSELEFVELDWWTVYQFGQRVAETFRQGPIILAGDAAHTHSSGAAQGMNTGLVDAANLGWKLAGVLRGWFTDAVLDTYASERKASAEHLIQLDRDVSTLISGKIPAHFDAPADADPNEYLERVFSTSASFTVGLGISYSANLLNHERETDAGLAHGVRVGHRARDVALFRSGARFPRRLFELVPYVGTFWILIFAGQVERTPDGVRLAESCAAKYSALRRALDAPDSFTCTLAPAFSFLTILRGSGAAQAAETLGAQPIGKAAYDPTGEAYATYGIDAKEGAIVVVRPDAIVCFVAALHGPGELGSYFREFVLPVVGKPSARTHTAEQRAGTTMGEIVLEDRNEGELTQVPMARVQYVDNPTVS